MEFSKITIFTGYFGSGKTELAVNLGLLMQKVSPTTVIDLDVVNPYFRSRKAKEQLELSGVKIVFPNERLAQADLPVVGPEVIGALNDPTRKIFIDVGGDKQGAIALAQFCCHLGKLEVETLFVINPFRPFTNTVEGISKIISSIERVSRQKIKTIISNPNLGRETTIKDVLEGHKLVEGFSKELSLPIKFMSVRSDLVDVVKNEINLPIVPIDIQMKVPWEI